MPSRELDLEITRRGRHEDYIGLTADPDDNGALQGALKGWLEGHGWSDGLWGQFELLVRYAGEGKIRRKVRL